LRCLDRDEKPALSELVLNEVEGVEVNPSPSTFNKVKVKNLEDGPLEYSPKKDFILQVVVFG